MWPAKFKLRAANGDPDQELPCAACKIEQGLASFGLRGTFTDGTPRYESICLKCRAKRDEKRRLGLQTHKLMNVVAPINAAKLLMEQNPEAILFVAQRFREDYVALLEAERQRLVTVRNNSVEYAKKRRKHLNSDAVMQAPTS